MKFKKTDPRALTPAYQTAGAACFDLAAVLEEQKYVYPRQVTVIRTGLAFEVPADMVLEVYVRSSLGFKKGLSLANGTGIIDSDYRGEVLVALINQTDDVQIIRPGERIAQAKLVLAPQYPLHEVAELSETSRGAGGFGSTG